MLTERKTTYFILISFPALFHPVKASEMKQETMRARHPVQNKEKLAEKYLKEELIKKK